MKPDCKFGASIFAFLLLCSFSVKAANFKLIVLSAVHQIDNAGLRPAEEKEMWVARTLVLDQKSGETFRCELTKYKPGLNSEVDRPICKRLIAVLVPGGNFEAELATPLPPPALETATSPLTRWSPAPMWMIETSRLQSLKFCDFSNVSVICTSGVTVTN